MDERFKRGDKVLWRKLRSRKKQRVRDTFKEEYGEGPFRVIMTWEPEEGVQTVWIITSSGGERFSFDSSWFRHVRH